MRSLLEKKPWILLLSLLALGALTVLSVSLKNVSFNDAQPIGREEAMTTLSAPQRAVIESLSQVSLKSQIIFWISLVTLVVLVGMLLPPESRKRIFRIIVRVAATYWALYFLLKSHPEILSAFNLSFNFDSPSQQDHAAVDIPPPVFTPPHETPLLSYLTSLLIVLGVMFLVWKVYRTWREANPAGRAGPLQDIARIARSSLDDLSSGRESTDVILNCYFRMSDVVADKRNMQRRPGMTPAEFAVRLEQAGLPGDAVLRLTRLFEGVRYGEKKAGPRDVNEAVACLTTIVQCCGESV
jgi:hypothetical protein